MLSDAALPALHEDHEGRDGDDQQDEDQRDGRIHLTRVYQLQGAADGGR